MMMNCSRAAETDAPVCERAHAHVQDDNRRKKQGKQPCRCGEGKRDRGGGGRKARKFGGGYGRRKRGSNMRDGQGGGRKRKSAMRL